MAFMIAEQKATEADIAHLEQLVAGNGAQHNCQQKSFIRN
jgi:hypothetical protein